MYKNFIKEQIDNSRTHHCTPPNLERNDLIHMEFPMDYQCEVQCFGSSKKIMNFTSTFNTQEEGLTQGDGYHPSRNVYLYSMFTTKSTLWANKHCIEQAIKHCDALDNLKKVKATEVGGMKIDKFCSPKGKNNFKKEKITRIPYFVNTDSYPTLSSEAIKSTTFNLRSKKNIIDDYEVTTDNISFKESKSSQKCKNKIEVNTCFGDCLAYESQKKEDRLVKMRPIFYESKRGNATSSLIICADDLINLIKQKKPPRVLYRQICESYIWESLSEMRKNNPYNQKTMGTSCSAYRGNTTCEKFIKSL